jgi:hypothetical protein
VIPPPSAIPAPADGPPPDGLEKLNEGEKRLVSSTVFDFLTWTRQCRQAEPSLLNKTNAGAIG